MTRRKPTKDEQVDLEYGRADRARARADGISARAWRFPSRACVAVEAMEGTDAMLRRAASLVNGKPLVLVKVATRRRHLLFDVPVVGVETIAVMSETGTTALAVDAGRTLMLDRDRDDSIAMKPDQLSAMSTIGWLHAVFLIREDYVSPWSASVNSGGTTFA